MDLWFKLNLTGFVLMVFTFLIGNIFCKEEGLSYYVMEYAWFWIPAGINLMLTPISTFCYAIVLIWI